MRILLVYPNAKKELLGWGDLGAIAEPIALEYVGAGARLDGHEVRLLDLRLHPDGLDETLATFRPDVTGVTGYSMHVLRDLEILDIAETVVLHIAMRMALTLRELEFSIKTDADRIEDFGKSGHGGLTPE